MNALRNTIQKLLEWVNVLIFVGITAVGAYQVISRYFLNNPSAWSEEVLTYGFTWLALLSASLVVGKRDHMRLTFIVDKLQLSSRKTLEIINEVIVIVFSALIFIVGGFLIMQLTRLQVTPALQMSMSTFYAILPISGVLNIILSIINIKDLQSGKIDLETPTDEVEQLVEVD